MYGALPLEVLEDLGFDPELDFVPAPGSLNPEPFQRPFWMTWL